MPKILEDVRTQIDPRYAAVIEHLIQIRGQCKCSQLDLGRKLGIDASRIAHVEALAEKLDLIELYDWLDALGYSHQAFLNEIGWIEQEENGNLPALPVQGKAIPHSLVVTFSGVKSTISGTLVEMVWKGMKKEVFLADIPADGYLALEAEISAIYKALNDGKGGKNREAILRALMTAIHKFPNANPSDIYHHVVYRLYLRDYNKTQADRSWVRAGGEAFELFLQAHYNPILNPAGITVRWLYNDELKSSALREMGINNEVGGSKLDIALYGSIDGRQVIFGGIHAKASLAERVSDDVPCSEAMMRKGLSSYLVTFDAKSYPPPTGDLINRGELGTIGTPSDKRGYIESHGSFSACFSYNLRTVPSGADTASGRRISSLRYFLEKLNYVLHGRRTRKHRYKDVCRVLAIPAFEGVKGNKRRHFHILLGNIPQNKFEDLDKTIRRIWASTRWSMPSIDLKELYDEDGAAFYLVKEVGYYSEDAVLWEMASIPHRLVSATA